MFQKSSKLQTSSTSRFTRCDLCIPELQGLTPSLSPGFRLLLLVCSSVIRAHVTSDLLTFWFCHPARGTCRCSTGTSPSPSRRATRHSCPPASCPSSSTRSHTCTYPPARTHSTHKHMHIHTHTDVEGQKGHNYTSL